MAYAVLATGGKQYRVVPGMKLRVEKLTEEEGSELTLGSLLAVHDGNALHVGQPTVEGWCVKAKVSAHGKGKKVTMIKMKRRKHHMKKQGHRQPFTQLEILDIAKA